MSVRRILARGVLALMASLVVAPAAAGQDPSLRIVRPTADQTVAGSEVVVEIEVEGAVLGGRNRNGAYALLTLDDMPPVKSLAARFTFRNVDAGDHTLIAELRRPDGSRFEPEVRARVAFRSGTRPGRSPRP